MIVEKMLELIILDRIFKQYRKDTLYSGYLDENYDMLKLRDRYEELGNEFLNDYALHKTEKSD